MVEKSATNAVFVVKILFCHQIHILKSATIFCHTFQWYAETPVNVSKVYFTFANDFISTVGAVRNETLVFVNFSAQDESILKICGHHQEEVLRILKHP